MNMRAKVGLVLVAVALNGCRHATTSVGTGATSFKVLEQPRPPPPPPSDKELVEPVNRANFREAQAVHPLVMPVYPPKALQAKAGAAQIGVRVLVDADGRVAEIRPSMLAISITPPGYADDFREAVEVAVRQWRFHPARVLYLERVTEKEFTYDRVKRTEMIEAEFDLAFTFTPLGKVETGAAAKTK